MHLIKAWLVLNTELNKESSCANVLSSYLELIDYSQILSLQCPVPSIQFKTHTSPGERQFATGLPASRWWTVL